ncbi:MAG: protein jag, partial [Epsilonproteobacteria bacterium]|nr:protein jag [Campylobacterota bacterium]
MIKIEAITLEDAYSQAAKQLDCSVTELTVEVVQYPSSGILGLFRKKAIIVASVAKVQEEEEVKPHVTQEKPLVEEKVELSSPSFVTAQENDESTVEEVVKEEEDNFTNEVEIAIDQIAIEVEK